jgi:hypothetical protein
MFNAPVIDWAAQVLATSRAGRHEAESVAEINPAALQEGGSPLRARVYVQIL